MSQDTATKSNKLVYAIAFLGLILFGSLIFAYSPEESQGLSSESITAEIGHFHEILRDHVVANVEKVLFFDILGPWNADKPEDQRIAVPFIVFWLVLAGVFFTLRLGFINFRLFGHAIAVVRGKYSSKEDPGEVTHFQALTAAVSATVGLGNIAGVAVAVVAGGPGAVIWMAIAGLLGMSTKFAEVTLGQKYRRFHKSGKVSGGAFYYLQEGLKELGGGNPKSALAIIGKILAILFAALCILGSLGGGNMFQSNQTVAMINSSIPSANTHLVSFVIAVMVGIVLIGGIKRIAHVAEAIVPLMAFIYITAALVVIGVNISALPEAIVTMFKSAFTWQAAGGGMMGALIMGFRRAAFSNEAGLGSAPIAHAAAKTKEPVREGTVALLEPFIDTVVICFITGILITVTGVYQEGGSNGVLLTSQAFGTVIDWFPMILTLAVVLFAFSTMITWSYYGERSWRYLFGNKSITVYHIIFCLLVFLGGALNSMDNFKESFDTIVNFSDMMLLSMSLPNLIGLYLLSSVVKRELNDYRKKLKNGKFKEHEAELKEMVSE